MPNQPSEYNQPYSLDFAISEVQRLSTTLPQQGKKLCLFIGRTPGEPFPGFGQERPEDEVWVSLDAALAYYSHEFVPGKQLHLQMDFNNPETMQRIHRLFGTVLVDFSTLKFFDTDNPWAYLKNLLTNQATSQLITEPKSKRHVTDPAVLLPFINEVCDDNKVVVFSQGLKMFRPSHIDVEIRAMIISEATDRARDDIHADLYRHGRSVTSQGHFLSFWEERLPFMYRAVTARCIVFTGPQDPLPDESLNHPRKCNIYGCL